MNRDFGLIDANINRAREGLRIIEDVIRFILRDRALFESIKTVRHKLMPIEQAFGSSIGLDNRRGTDVGQQAVVASEYNRQSLWDILKANFTRAEEAVRVLEEFGKIYIPQKVVKIEEVRYDIYKLEFQTLVQTPHYWLHLYFDAGVVYPLSDNVDELVWLIDHGARVVQLRDKKSSTTEVYNKAKYLCEYIKKEHQEHPEKGRILFFINDSVDIACSLPVAGVHIGQDDASITNARRKLGSRKIIGHSNGSLVEMENSIAQGADYVSIGPVFATPNKAEHAAVGLEEVKKVADALNVPWLAIGGINKENVQQLYCLGAKNVSVIRAAREFFS